MPVKRRKEGSFQVTVGIGGRTVRRSSRHWSHADAKAVERQLIAEAADVAAGRKPDRTLPEALERWLTEHVPKLRSARKTRNHAAQLLPFLSGRLLSEAPQVWAEVKAAHTEHAPGTINHKGRILRQLCNLAQREWAWTDEAIGSRIKMLPETPREAFLTLKQVNALSKACSSTHARDLVLFAAYTGVRYSQMFSIVGRDQVKGNVLHLDRKGKTRRLQALPLHERVQAIAKRMPLPITEKQLRTEWSAARSKLGLSHVRWHDLRHTCASWLVQAGVPLYEVMQLLGHSTMAMTQRYAHLQTDQLARAVARLR